MSDADWIDGLRGQRHLDLSLSQAETVQKMVTDGDLLHCDGLYVKALALMADAPIGHAMDLRGDGEVYLDRLGAGWEVHAEGYRYGPADARDALDEALHGPLYGPRGSGHVRAGWTQDSEDAA